MHPLCRLWEKNGNQCINKKGAAAKEAAAFVKRTEQLYINALEEMGAKYVDGKIAMAERDEEEEGVDNEESIVYNNTIHASKKGTTKNSPYFLHQNFPAGEPWREAHRLAIWWSNNPNVSTGDQTLISMNDRWYLVEKFDDADNGYQVEALISKKEFNKILKEIKENGRSGKIKPI